MRLPRRDGLNVIPLIDIMLVLLAIVLSISTFIAQGKIKVDLPKSQNAVKKSEDARITVKIDSDSVIYIDDERVSDDEINRRIAEIDHEALIVLKSDKNAKFEKFIEVIDALKSAKHENFAIVTEIQE